MEEKPMIIQLLNNFSSEIATYQYLQRREHLSPENTKLMTNLRFDALKGVGVFKPLITEITGKEKLTFRPKGARPPYLADVWLTALQLPYDKMADNCISSCLDLITITIGRLEEDIKKGIRDRQGNLIEKSQIVSTEPLKAFIAHGGDSPALAKLKSFLEALGVQPLTVEEQPSEGRSIAENVDHYARQVDCAIILATKGDIDGKTGRFIPRGNVLMEIGKLQEIFKDRIIYLLQAGVKFPTNVSEKVRERFTSQNMDNAFIKIAKELREFGILKAVKP